MKMIDNRNWIWIVAGIGEQLELDSNWHWAIFKKIVVPVFRFGKIWPILTLDMVKNLRF